METLHPKSPAASWGDLVLIPSEHAKLKELCGRARELQRRLDGQGVERKTSAKKGLVVLFSGSSGVGKAKAAGVVASELGAPLLEVDLSTIVRKVSAETEDTLGRVFDRAEAAKAVLLFTKVDALFSRRSGSPPDRDRYANTEAEFFIRKAQAFKGLVILAANFRRKKDKAFLHRMKYIIEFRAPKSGARSAQETPGNPVAQSDKEIETG
ncbi:MAG: AAA family ATPase [Desulfobacterales bacterium]